MINYSIMPHRKAQTIQLECARYGFSPVESKRIAGHCTRVQCVRCSKQYDWNQTFLQRKHFEEEHVMQASTEAQGEVLCLVQARLEPMRPNDDTQTFNLLLTKFDDPNPLTAAFTTIGPQYGMYANALEYYVSGAPERWEEIFHSKLLRSALVRYYSNELKHLGWTAPAPVWCMVAVNVVLASFKPYPGSILKVLPVGVIEPIDWRVKTFTYQYRL